MSADTSASAPGASRVASRRWYTNPSLIVGASLVLLVVLMAVVSYLWTPYDPTEVDPAVRLQGPSIEHWLGTDTLGRDVFSNLLTGARVTLLVGLISVGVGALVGVPLGIAAAVSRPWVSQTTQRSVDLLLAFPALLLAIAFGAIWGASTLTAMLAIGLATAPIFARLARSGTLQILATEYVPASRVAGHGTVYIVRRHVLPNIFGLLVVQASVTFGIAVLAESGLSYLGFGTPPPTPSWGLMLQQAQPVLYTEPLLSLWPALAIVIAVLGFNLLGDGLRDHFDPQLDDRK